MRVSLEKQCVANPDKGLIMRDMISYMRENLGKVDLSQTFISKKYGMSVSSLNRNFKNFTGKTYMEVLSMMRLNKMISLLEDGNMKDYDIGEKIGIPDPHYLSIWFKKMTGLSVTEYRNTLM